MSVTESIGAPLYLAPGSRRHAIHVRRRRALEIAHHRVGDDGCQRAQQAEADHQTSQLVLSRHEGRSFKATDGGNRGNSARPKSSRLVESVVVYGGPVRERPINGEEGGEPCSQILGARDASHGGGSREDPNSPPESRPRRPHQRRRTRRTMRLGLQA